MELWSTPRTTLLTAAVWAAGLHSALLGVALIAAPYQLFGLFDWHPTCETFFWHQVGIFHVVIGAAYIWDYLRSNSVVILVGAKCAAVVFLSLECLLGPCEVGKLLAGGGDGAMAIGMVALVWWTERSSSAR